MRWFNLSFGTNIDEAMYVKRIPRELAVTTVDDPCNPVDGFFFIWTSMTKFGCRYKGSMEKYEHGKREDEAMDGDGVVTMKTHEKM